MSYNIEQTQHYFVCRIAFQVEWGAEKECFQSFGQECSRFYAFKADSFDVNTTADVDESTASHSTEAGMACSWHWTVEHVLFPAFRSGLVPPRRFAEDGTLLQVADLHDLYKVFERC